MLAESGGEGCERDGGEADGDEGCAFEVRPLPVVGGRSADEEEAVALVYLGDVEGRVFVAVVKCHEAAADAGLDDVNFALTQHIERRAVGGDGAEHDVEAFGVEEAPRNGSVDGRVEEVAVGVHEAEAVGFCMSLCPFSVQLVRCRVMLSLTVRGLRVRYSIG